MKKTALYIMAAFFALMACDAWAYTSQECIRCHEEGSPKSTRHIPVEAFKASVHGELGCSECHTGVKGEDHETMAGLGAVNCRQCHEQINRHGVGKRDENRPYCYSCHTKHAILPKDVPASSVNPHRLVRTCRGCHPVECGLTGPLTWLPSLRIKSHKKQDFGRNYEESNCLGCHQGSAAHGEGGSIDHQDCYKCHRLTAGQAAIYGYIHPTANYRREPGVFFAALLYLPFAGALLWGGFRFYVKRSSRK